jgi:hypothetical protein
MKESRSSPTDRIENKNQIELKKIPNSNIPTVLEHDNEHDFKDEYLRQYTPAELKKIKVRGVISVIGGILLHVVIGTFYTWGTISKILK